MKPLILALVVCLGAIDASACSLDLVEDGSGTVSIVYRGETRTLWVMNWDLFYPVGAEVDSVWFSQGAYGWVTYENGWLHMSYGDYFCCRTLIDGFEIGGAHFDLSCPVKGRFVIDNINLNGQGPVCAGDVGERVRRCSTEAARVMLKYSNETSWGRVKAIYRGVER